MCADAGGDEPGHLGSPERDVPRRRPARAGAPAPVRGAAVRSRRRDAGVGVDRARPGSLLPPLAAAVHGRTRGGRGGAGAVAERTRRRAAPDLPARDGRDRGRHRDRRADQPHAGPRRGRQRAAAARPLGRGGKAPLRRVRPHRRGGVRGRSAGHWAGGRDLVRREAAHDARRDDGRCHGELRRHRRLYGGPDRTRDAPQRRSRALPSQARRARPRRHRRRGHGLRPQLTVRDTVAVATVSVTFDNLGEAAELERGTWPEGQPLGEHFTVRECLPELLGLLAREDLRATFFLEGHNGELYPDAVAGLRAAGHEVACHGWRHEPWHGVSDERGRLERARAALGGPIGFRPPGGRLNPETPELLSGLGYRYCSPAGSRVGRLGGLAVLPFRWELIDAYFYLPHFGSLRERNGDPEAPMEPRVVRERVLAALDAPTEGRLALIFPPFLLTAAPDALSVVADVLARVAELDHMRMDEAAAALPHDAGPPELDDAGWDD